VENAFDLLEERVRRAADALRRLQAENADLKKQLGGAQAALGKAERALEAAEKHKAAASSEDGRRAEAMSQELAALRRDRDELRTRIGRLLDALEGLD
jgi:predicted  nucleic acid-binding Zn-ribbon protein